MPFLEKLTLLFLVKCSEEFLQKLETLKTEILRIYFRERFKH